MKRILTFSVEYGQITAFINNMSTSIDCCIYAMAEDKNLMLDCVDVVTLLQNKITVHGINTDVDKDPTRSIRQTHGKLARAPLKQSFCKTRVEVICPLLLNQSPS